MSAADPALFEQLRGQDADLAFRHRVRAVLDWMPLGADDRLLDCGSGRGFHLVRMHAAGRSRMVGIELDARMQDHARKQIAGLDRVALARADLLALPFNDACFDGVLVSEVLEHVEDEDRALAEVARVLKPGGTTVITVPHARYPWLWDPLNRLLEDRLGTHIRGGPLAGIWTNHRRLYSRERLQQVVEAAGLVIDQQRSFVRYCMPFSHNLLYGLGMPLVDGAWLPAWARKLVDRSLAPGGSDGAPRWNPMAVLVRAFRWFDRYNRESEDAEVPTVNLALRARKPG